MRMHSTRSNTVAMTGAERGMSDGMFEHPIPQHYVS
jgi:hypothetical protein